MKLYLQNFGCYGQHLEEFPDHGLMRISGVTGAGKSTLFHAIVWLLTGRGEDVIKHGTGSTEKVMVRLEYIGLIIQREKRPEMFYLFYQGVTYQKDQAMAVLQSFWGSSDLLVASSYLAQDVDHLLLTSSPKERLALLQEASLAQENPEQYLVRVDVQVKQAQATYQTNSAYFYGLQHNWQQRAGQCDWSQYVANDLSNEIKTIEMKLHNLQQQLSQAVYVAGQREQLQQQLQRLPAVKEYPTDLSSQITRLQQLQLAWVQYHEAEKLQQAQDAERQRQEKFRLQLQEQLTHVPEGPELEKIPNNLNILWHQWESEQEILNREHITSSAEKEVKIKIYQQELQERQKIPLQEDVKKLQDQLHGLTVPDLTILQQEIFQLQQAQHPLQCPSCQVKLRYTSNKLEMFQGREPDLQKLQALSKEYAQGQHISRQQQELQQKQKMLGTLSLDPTLTKISSSQLQESLRDLARVKFLARPVYTTVQLDAARKRRELQQQLNHVRILEVKKMGLQKPEDFSANELSRLQQLHLEQLQQEAREKQRSELQERLQQLPMMVDINALQQQQNDANILLKKLQEQQRQILIMQNLLQEKNVLEQNMIQLETQRQELEDWLHIQRVIIETEYQLLTDAVDTVNAALRLTIREVFDNLDCQLSLARKNKDGSQKHQISLNFYRQGQELINPRLSGGERKRLSLALTLAFRCITKSPWILLDETFASLDEEHCRRARESILQHLKLVSGMAVVIDHHDLKGVYDKHLQVMVKD